MPACCMTGHGGQEGRGQQPPVSMGEAVAALGQDPTSSLLFTLGVRVRVWVVIYSMQLSPSMLTLFQPLVELFFWKRLHI